MAVFTMIFLTMCAMISQPPHAKPTPYFKIQVVDEATGRGIPVIELRTVNQIRFITDSAGLIAFNEPGLMDREVYFYVSGPGYTVEPDSFGYRGVALKPQAGGSAVVRLKRTNVAERLCRLTGQGIYRDSVLLGEPIPLRDPVLNGGVLGQDTAQAEVVGGKMLWFWGDTDRTGYPLGNFHTSGAIANLPKGGADSGIEFRYFTNKDGFVKSMVPSSKSMPIWISGLAVLGNDLYAYYAQMKSLGSIDSSGYAKWDGAKQSFDIVQTFDKARSWRFLDGHTLQVDGWIYGNNPLNVRVKADAESLLDPSDYEAFTCLDSKGNVQRNEGKADYRWQKELPPITSDIEDRLVKEGKLRQDETHFLPLEESGKPCVVVSGSIHWSAYRKRYAAILGRKGGKDSFLGEIVYAEADSPTGPFKRAVTVVDHPHYTFYNPVWHSFLDKGSFIYFEGTYTAEFSDAKEKTPMYNYNQLLYRLDLSDKRLSYAREP